MHLPCQEYACTMSGICQLFIFVLFVDILKRLIASVIMDSFFSFTLKFVIYLLIIFQCNMGRLKTRELPLADKIAVEMMLCAI